MIDASTTQYILESGMYFGIGAAVAFTGILFLLTLAGQVLSLYMNRFID